MTFLGGGLLAILLIALWAWCIFDVISTDESLVRNMPKVLWLIVVILLPTVGSVAWLVLGRPSGAGLRPGDTSPYRPALVSSGASGAGAGRRPFLPRPARRRDQTAEGMGGRLETPRGRSPAPGRRGRPGRVF